MELIKYENSEEFYVLSQDFAELKDKYQILSSTLIDDGEITLDDGKYSANKAGEYNIKIVFSSLNSFEKMFKDNQNLISLDLSHINADAITNMNFMFNNCQKLKSVIFPTRQSITNAVTVENMFTSCFDLTSLDFSRFKIKVTGSAIFMFAYCGNLISLDLSNFNTEEVTNMGCMFDGCSTLKSLDLSNFNTGKVTIMDSMFNECNNLESLDLSNFNTEIVEDSDEIFAGLSSLAYINLKNYVGEDIFEEIAGIENLKICVGDNVPESLKKFENICPAEDEEPDNPPQPGQDTTSQPKTDTPSQQKTDTSSQPVQDTTSQPKTDTPSQPVQDTTSQPDNKSQSNEENEQNSDNSEISKFIGNNYILASIIILMIL